MKMETKIPRNKQVKAMRFRYRNTFKGAARWPETIVKHGQEGGYGLFC